jgi:gliding motility-associated-like protein
MYKQLLPFLLFLGLTFSIKAQDIGVIQVLSPSSGCMLSSSESVSIQLFNYGQALTGSFDVSYRINAGPVVTETIILPFTFLQNSTYTYTFLNSANLSLNGSYLFDFYTSLASDINNANDSILAYQVNCDQMTMGGLVSTPNTIVCSGSNSGVISLSGQLGDVEKWEFSVNSGSSWSNIANTGITLNFNNITNPTTYRAVVKNGMCPEENSATVEVLIDQPSISGLLSPGGFVCYGSNSGTINLTGFTGDILDWEYSEDFGSSWNSIGNQTSAHSYLNLINTTSYRAIIQNGTCNAVYTQSLLISVLPVPVGGNTSGSATVCSGANSGSISLTGITGQVSNWEYSEDGLNWVNIPSNSSNYNYLNLTNETMFRAKVTSCGQFDYSSITVIYIDQVSSGGQVSGGQSFCLQAAAQVLSLNNNLGSITDWEYASINSPAWQSLSLQSQQITTTNITETTYFRAVVKNGVCPIAYSDVDTIFIDEQSVPGQITGNLATCKIYGQGQLFANPVTGNVQFWEESTDAINWQLINSSGNSIFYQNLNSDTYFRVIVKNGVCAEENSLPVLVETIPLSVAGQIFGDTSVCKALNQGEIEITGNTGTLVWQSSLDKINWKNITNNGNVYEYNNLLQTTYYRTISTNQSCPSDTSMSSAIMVFPENLTLIKYSEQEIKRGESINLYGGYGVSYLWSPSTALSSSIEASPQASPQETIKYTLHLTDEYSCVDTAIVLVKVSSEYELLISNLITPNRDGYNDTWEIMPAYLKPDVKVFSLNGKLVFESSAYENNWDATINGNVLADGVYYYLVKINGKEIKGTLNILKGF